MMILENEGEMKKWCPNQSNDIKMKISVREREIVLVAECEGRIDQDCTQPLG